MLKVAVIEDSKDKQDAIKKNIEKYYTDSQIHLDVFEDTISAKRSLSNTLYDLCILDINLPTRKGETPQKDAGKILLDEIHEMDNIYNIPKKIIGLTSYDDIYQASEKHFNNYLCNLVFYENSSNVWATQIEKLIKRLLMLEKHPTSDNQSKNKKECTVCIVNALDEPELSAILDLDWEWEEYEAEDDPTIYYHCKVTAKSGTECTLYTAASEHMGMPSITALSMKMITTFSPNYIGITGISAGTRGEVNLGDVIVADPTWDWGSGKYVIEDGKSVFKPAPYQFCLGTRLRNKFRAMQRSSELSKKIKSTWKEKVPTEPFNIHIGPVASGASVLADKKEVEKIKTQHRKMLGIEMEAFGVFSAANNAPIPQPEPFSIKSVCDFADDTKTDDFHSYAAYTSAMTLKELIEGYL